MSNRSPAILDANIPLIREYLGLIDPTGRLPLSWAVKDMTRLDPKDGFQAQPIADNAEAFLNAALKFDAATHSIFLCPAPRQSAEESSRKASTALHSRWVWADFDHHLSDEPFPLHLFTHGGPLADCTMLIKSGTPGNYHAYPRTTNPVSTKTLRVLNYAFARLIRGDMGKWPDNAYLRPAGWFNPKRELNTPQPIEIVQRATSTISAKDLLSFCIEHAPDSLTLDEIKAKTRDYASSARKLKKTSTKREDLLTRMSAAMASMIRRNALSTQGQTESEQLYNVLRELYKNSDLDEDEVYTVMLDYAPMTSRYSPDSIQSQVFKAFAQSEATPDRKEARDKFMGKPSASTEPEDDEQPERTTHKKPRIPQWGTDAAKAEAFSYYLTKAIPNIYRMGSGWVIVRPSGQHDEPTILPLDAQTLISQAHRYTDLFTFKKDKKTDKRIKNEDGEYVTIPAALTANTAAIVLKDVETKGRHLQGLSALPCLVRRDGTLISEPGYDESTQLFFTHTKPMDLPDRVSKHDIAEAERFIFKQVLADVHWRGPGDLANYFAMLMTPVLRRYIGLENHVPAAGLDANSSGAGKGLLFAILSNVNPANNMPFENTTKALNQNIPVYLASPSAVVRIDNVSEPIKHDRYCELMTSSVWNTRRLHTTTGQVALPNDKLWVFTGNNLRFEGDMRTRAVVARINTQPNPEARKGFVLDNLISDVGKPDFQRAIYRALVVLAMGWLQAGAPEADLVNRTFTRWMQVMGGLCKHYNLPGFMNNLKDLKNSDTETNEMEGFLDWWYEELGSKAVTVRDLITASKAEFTNEGGLISLRFASDAWLDNEFEEILKTRGSAGVQLGKKLNKHVDGQFGSYQLNTHPRKVNNRTMYLVKKVK